MLHVGMEVDQLKQSSDDTYSGAGARVDSRNRVVLSLPVKLKTPGRSGTSADHRRPGAAEGKKKKKFSNHTLNLLPSCDLSTSKHLNRQETFDAYHPFRLKLSRHKRRAKLLDRQLPCCDTRQAQGIASPRLRLFPGRRAAKLLIREGVKKKMLVVPTPAASTSLALPLSETLTVVLTTSPTPSSPSTELLDSILASFREFCPLLLSCRVVVVFDTFDRIAAENRLKKGSVTAEGAANFPSYKRKVEELVLRAFSGTEEERDQKGVFVTEEGRAEYGSPMTPGDPNYTTLAVRRTEDRRVTFVEPSERLGFGLAVRSALRLVETPYVWIQQHDWRLDASVPVQSIVDVMISSDEEVPVKYVCLPSVRLLAYAVSAHVTRFSALRELTSTLKRDFQSRSGETIPLTPLFFWHDKTHIASTEHYLGRIFPSRLAMPRGAFIEDHVGQRARNQMKEGLWKKWACWLYYPDGGRQLCLRHLHGRTWRGTEGERVKIHAFKLENGILEPPPAAAVTAGDEG